MREDDMIKELDEMVTRLEKTMILNHDKVTRDMQEVSEKLELIEKQMDKTLEILGLVK